MQGGGSMQWPDGRDAPTRIRHDIFWSVGGNRAGAWDSLKSSEKSGKIRRRCRVQSLSKPRDTKVVQNEREHLLVEVDSDADADEGNSATPKV